jgi:hypothetical protein
VRAMEAVLGVLMIVSVVIFVWVRISRGVPPHRVPPPRGQTRGASTVPPVLPASPSSHDDAAFFDGYIWGRLQERHDEQQHGPADEHDHDMFDGDDSFDDDD